MNETVPSPPPPPDAADAPSDRSRRLRLIGLGVIATILIGGLWLAFRSPADLVQGMADADSINVSAKVTARVSALLVAEGERVEAGQVLFELDSPEVAAKQQQAEAALAAAQAQADKAEEGTRVEDIRAAEANWRRAQAGSELARSTFQRLERLHTEGVVTRQRRDEARAKAGRKLCYMFNSWFEGSLEYVMASAGHPRPLKAREVYCRAEGQNDHCLFEVAPAG